METDTHGYGNTAASYCLFCCQGKKRSKLREGVKIPEYVLYRELYTGEVQVAKYIWLVEVVCTPDEDGMESLRGLVVYSRLSQVFTSAISIMVSDPVLYEGPRLSNRACWLQQSATRICALLFNSEERARLTIEGFGHAVGSFASSVRQRRILRLSKCEGREACTTVSEGCEVKHEK